MFIRRSEVALIACKRFRFRNRVLFTICQILFMFCFGKFSFDAKLDPTRNGELTRCLYLLGTTENQPNSTIHFQLMAQLPLYCVSTCCGEQVEVKHTRGHTIERNLAHWTKINRIIGLIFGGHLYSIILTLRSCDVNFYFSFQTDEHVKRRSIGLSRLILALPYNHSL